MAQSYHSPEVRKSLATTLRNWATYVTKSSYVIFILSLIADIILLMTLYLEDFFWVLFIVIGVGLAELFLGLMTSVVIAALAEMTEAAYNFNEREYAAQKEIAARNEELRRQQLEEERKARAEEERRRAEERKQKEEERRKKEEEALRAEAELELKKIREAKEKEAEIRRCEKIWSEDTPLKASVPAYEFKSTHAVCPFCHQVIEVSSGAKERGQTFCDECGKSFNLLAEVEATEAQIEESKKQAELKLQQEIARLAEEKRLQKEKEREERERAEMKEQEKAYVYTMDEAVCPFCGYRTHVAPSARFTRRGFCDECGKSFILSKSCEPKD